MALNLKQFSFVINKLRIFGNPKLSSSVLTFHNSYLYVMSWQVRVAYNDLVLLAYNTGRQWVAVFKM